MAISEGSARRPALSPRRAPRFVENLCYGKDVDLIWRILAARHVVRYEPRTLVYHRPRPTLRYWLRQTLNYGTSAAPLSKRHPDHLAPVLARLSTAEVALFVINGRRAAAATLSTVGAVARPMKLCDTVPFPSMRTVLFGQ